MDPVFTDYQHMKTHSTLTGQQKKALWKLLGPVSNQLEKQKTHWVKESVFGGVETN